jgi:tRNA dimethylallyltransferase
MEQTAGPITIIIGPTASGKSALALERAKNENAAIINADAMQCYDALPILTAQPAPDERAGIPHRLYGVLPATERLTAAGWVDLAAKEIQAAFDAGKKPYLVGGTGLYLKALIEGLSPMPDIPDEVRTALRAREKAQGLAALYADLKKNDPLMAARLKPGDTQRILRAMEVLEATGESLAAWQEAPPRKPHDGWQFHVVQLNPPREILEAKIRARLSAMLKNNVMDEVKTLSDRIDSGAVPEDAPIIVAHGFRHLRAALKGQKKLEDAIEATAIETRQYTKRQRTWLRHQIRADETIAS